MLHIQDQTGHQYSKAAAEKAEVAEELLAFLALPREAQDPLWKDLFACSPPRKVIARLHARTATALEMTQAAKLHCSLGFYNYEFLVHNGGKPAAGARLPVGSKRKNRLATRDTGNRTWRYCHACRRNRSMEQQA